MEALQLLKFSIRQGRGLDFTEGLSWENELAEMELISTESIIDDMIAVEA